MNNIPDVPMQVEVDPNEDTEWNDILRKHGVIPEKPPSPTPIIQEALEEARRLAHENRLEGKDLDELDELEDEEDEGFLEGYRFHLTTGQDLTHAYIRQKRFAELATISTKSIYNQVYPLQKPDWSREVTDESANAFVLVLLTSSNGTNTESRIAIELWRELARKFGDVKFCQIRGDLCIEGYPDRNTPTIIVYRDGDVRRQVVTLREVGGVRTGMSDMEKLLVELGAIKQGDSRLRQKTDEDADESSKGIRGSTQADEDSDWD